MAFQSNMLEQLTNKFKAVFLMGTGAYYLGLGFIIGIRYAAIICAGSFLSYFVIVPLLGQFDLQTLHILNSHPDFTDTNVKTIWYHIPRSIGIGGIFAAGLISILKMSGVMVTALRQALGGLFRAGSKESVQRIEEDMSYSSIVLLGIAVIVAMGAYFRFFVLNEMPDPMRLTLVAVAVTLGVAFLFTTVSAWAIAVISTTPISGMTVTTVIITAVALLAAGLEKGERGMLATLLVGGVVCTALSMAGTLVTEFKIGYWLGATPRKIQWSAIAGSVLASAAVTATIMLLSNTQGYIKSDAHPDPLSAPQANLMASAVQGFLGAGGQVPWLLYGCGAAVSVILFLLGVSPLAFALGMYLPQEINTSILLGGFVAWLVGRGKDASRTKARNDKGILVASGLIAGAAIMDVILNLFSALIDDPFLKGKVMPALDLSARQIAQGGDPVEVARQYNWLGLVALLALSLFAYIDCRRAKPPREA